MGQDGRQLSGLAMSNWSTVRTLFSMKPTKRLLTSSHHDEGAFAREQGSHRARGGEVADVAVSDTFCHGVEGFSEEEQRIEGVRLGKRCQHICGLVSSRGRVINMPRFMMPMVVSAVYIPNKIRGFRDGRLQRHEIETTTVSYAVKDLLHLEWLAPYG